jgi:hypothetical protein
MEFYAHSIDRKPVDEWHRLEEHEGTVLILVAREKQ